MRHKVLLVDDEPDITESLKRALFDEPYQILTADTAKEALGILAKEPVDVVVSDENMPGMSGLEFLTVVRSNYPDTIRMILTGQASLDLTIRAINEGNIYKFLTKPYNGTELAFTIRHALQQKDLMEKANQLLKVSRRQSSIIERFKRNHPEILEIERDSDGAIVIEESTEELDPDKLIMEITEETKKIS